jgi:hypothetical protein
MQRGRFDEIGRYIAVDMQASVRIRHNGRRE